MSPYMSPARILIILGSPDFVYTPVPHQKGFCLHFPWEGQAFISLSETLSFKPQEGAG